MVVVNLNQFGMAPPCEFTQAQLAATLDTAEAMIRDCPEQDIDQLLERWESALAWSSMTARGVDEAWCQRALAVLCLRGLRGEMRPDFWYFGTSD